MSNRVVFWFEGWTVEESIKNCSLPPNVFDIHSVDLPCHGNYMRPGEPAGLKGWRYRIDHDEVLLDDFCAKCSTMLDKLGTPFASVGGVSRGAFAAMVLSTRDPRFENVSALSPVTDLRKLEEFSDVGHDPLPLNIDALSQRSIFLSIESRDDRVSTTSTVALASAIANGERDADISLFVEPGNIHAVTNRARFAAQQWLLWRSLQ